jgi:hypothetical protein
MNSFNGLDYLCAGRPEFLILHGTTFNKYHAVRFEKIGLWRNRHEQSVRAHIVKIFSATKSRIGASPEHDGAEFFLIFSH